MKGWRLAGYALLLASPHYTALAQLEFPDEIRSVVCPIWVQYSTNFLRRELVQGRREFEAVQVDESEVEEITRAYRELLGPPSNNPISIDTDHHVRVWKFRLENLVEYSEEEMRLKNLAVAGDAQRGEDGLRGQWSRGTLYEFWLETITGRYGLCSCNVSIGGRAVCAQASDYYHRFLFDSPCIASSDPRICSWAQ